MAKVGDKECSSGIIIFGICFLVFELLSAQYLKYLTGGWINSIFCIPLSFALLLPLYKYYKIFGNKNVYELSCNVIGKHLATILFLVMCTVIIIHISAVFSQSVTKIYDLSNFKINSILITTIILVTATIGASVGIEAITRLSYLLLFAVGIIMALLFIISFDGAKFDNLSPLFGKSFKITFTPGIFLTINSPFLIMFFLSDSFKKTEQLINSSKKIFIVLSFISFALILWYTLCVPLTIAINHNSDIGTLFSASSSGSFVRRFEFLLMILYIVIIINFISLGVFSVCKIIGSIIHVNDVRMIVYSIGILIYNISPFTNKLGGLTSSVMSYIVFLYPLLIIFINWIRNMR